MSGPLGRYISTTYSEGVYLMQVPSTQLRIQVRIRDPQGDLYYDRGPVFCGVNYHSHGMTHGIPLCRQVVETGCTIPLSIRPEACLPSGVTQ